MPTYEYSCGACGTVSEINHRMSDPSPTDCPVCGKPQLSKLMSAAGFRLKGGGWYETDFKSDGKRNLAGDSGSTAGDGAKSDTTTAAKPAGGGDAAASAPAKTEVKTESKPAAAPASKPASPGGGNASSP
ncbi:MAG: zinc ribbon protein [Panacagrimonas sp.]|jgi:putative FmdB family regulatory protein|nr:zinc ribbon domain-containing protein [Panacagrimonas sp.]MCC2655937.1 zinc ribbon protein [Panacagrimonas sp.]